MLPCGVSVAAGSSAYPPSTVQAQGPPAQLQQGRGTFVDIDLGPVLRALPPGCTLLSLLPCQPVHLGTFGLVYTTAAGTACAALWRDKQLKVQREFLSEREAYSHCEVRAPLQPPAACIPTCSPCLTALCWVFAWFMASHPPVAPILMFFHPSSHLASNPRTPITTHITL